ncbi:probable translocator protein at N-terminal half [Coccomyxa sp. Obi]|nr:probable translocator protein at N-terminal half [Coccomyxa sp. Obi]
MGSYFSVPLAISIAIPLIAGSVVSASTADNVLVWYKTLKKPSWNLPTPVFGPTWSFLYVFLGLASFVVWTQGGFAEQTGPLVLYAINLVLNLSWMPIFFNKKDFGLAQIDNLATLATAVVLAKQFYRVKPVAGYLLWPYVAFLTFANALNFFHLKNNSNRTIEEDLYHQDAKKNPGEPGYDGVPDKTSTGEKNTGGVAYGGSTTGGTFGGVSPGRAGYGGSTTGGTFSGPNQKNQGQTGYGGSMKGYPTGGANACLSSACTGRGRSGRAVYVRAAATQMKTRAVAPVRASMSLHMPVTARFA